MANDRKQCWLMKGCPSRTGACYSCVPDGDECPIWRWFKKQILLKEQGEQTRPIYNGRYWECEQCGEKYKDILAVKEYKHCPGCGRRIEWQG
jgi:hypothetical protein